MKYFSTFSGVGGFELGIQQAYERIQVPVEASEKTWEEVETVRHLSDDTINTAQERGQSATCVGYSEFDKYAVQIYEQHFNHKNYGDITKINAEELPDFDLLVGGFPCQAFSIAGKRGGFDDTRGTLFFDLARILKAKRPRLCVFENVKGLLSHDEGRTFRTIISTLDDLGYDLQWQVLNSKNHGVPQNRERVFIVGHLRGTPRPKVFPFTETTGTTDERLEQGDTEVASTLRSRYGNGTGSHIEVGAIRRLTPVECERLQGFPDGWTASVSDTQRYKTMGNAVTVNVVRDVMERLLYPSKTAYNAPGCE